MTRHLALAAASLVVLSAAAPALAQEDRSLDEVRNTVVNLLEALVEKGVVSQEQARGLVADARGQADRDAQARAAEDADAAGAVRVTYVPQVVRDDISADVREQLRPEVVEDVVAQARAEGWGVPAGLPDWIRGLRLYGDMRARVQSDLFASDNAEFAYLDFLKVNEKGGIAKAGDDAFLNTTQDRFRYRVRARLGVEAQLGEGFTTGLRMATGNFRDPVSTNQTMAQAGGRYTFGLDQAYVRYEARDADQWPWLSVAAGRTTNPFLSTDLLFDNDLTFEGVTASYRYGFPSQDRHVFVTAGAYPIEEVELSSDDKWLYAMQLGTHWEFDEDASLRAGLAYYHYDNVTGIRNDLDSTAFDYTAPLWLQKGNTLFDIRNDADPTTNLFALAADYEIVNLFLAWGMPLFDDYELELTADYVTNLGFDEGDVLARTGLAVDGRTDGYLLEAAFGHPKLDRRHAWRAAIRYRYLERDAVLDAYTDSDFHLGGTDSKGYVIRGDYGLGRRVYASLRYLSANEIDGPPLGIDVIQLDVTGQF